jgi:hypothetical protein
MSRVILFGAGASYGAEPVAPHAPPLGGALFDALRAAYPEAWGKISDSERSAFVPNFELGMRKIWEGGSHAGPVLVRCMAHYFTRFRPLPGNTYERVLRKLGQQGAIDGTFFSSLNYECVLECAARDYGYTNIDYFGEGPTANDSFLLWKIHGSCNFVPLGVKGQAGGVSISPGVSIDGDLGAVALRVARGYSEQSAFSPSIAVFMEGKPVQSCPSVIRSLQGRWAAEIRRADVVGLVGVHPNLADGHIWDPLSEAPGKVVVIGDEEANRVWASTHREGRSTMILGPYFRDHVDEFAEAMAS